MEPAVLGAISGVVGTAITALLLVFHFGARIAALEVKVDTLWQFLWRRGGVETVLRGLGEKQSPIVVTPEAAALMGPLGPEIKVFYDKLGKVLPDVELALLIEKQFGERIIDEVCTPNGIFEGACLVIAVAIAKGRVGMLLS